MELEEAEDEEWDTITTSQNWSETNANSGDKVNCVFKRGLTLGRKILVAGFVASSAPLVVPPLVVASAIGLAVSMPYAFLLASHTCTQNLMSKLLPSPTPHYPPHVCFQPDIDIAYKSKEDPALKDEAKRDNEIVYFNFNEENMTAGNDYEQGVVREEVQENGSDSEKDSSDYLCEEEEPSHQKDDEELGDKIYGGLEGHIRRENDGEKPMSGGTSTIIEGLDKNVDKNEEFETPFEFGVTTIVLEECQDQVKEGGDIEEVELQRETKGLLEKIRDEGRTDMRGEYVEGIHRGTNESDQSIGPEDTQSLETEGEMRKEEDSKVCEEVLLSRNGGDDKDTDTICNEVESSEPVRGIFEVDSSNDSLKPMAETSELLDGRGFQCETILAESIGDLLIETQVFNISVGEDSSEVTNDKTDTDEIFEVEPEATILQKGKSDDNFSDFVNQEPQLHDDNKIMDSSDAEARGIADETGLRLCDENRIDPDVYSYTIDLQEESSNVMVDAHTDSMEVLVSSVELDSRSSECSSGRNIICPSEEVLFSEENIWKQIHVIRKIIGYEGTTQASCADELKALYIFTGVEPPAFVKENPFDPAEVDEKLHFLMSIVGIKSNVP